MYRVKGERPDGRAGDTIDVEADSREDATAEFLKAHPGWVVTEVYKP